jgi:hypothetical protein
MPGRFSFKRLLGWDNHPSHDHENQWWRESLQRRKFSHATAFLGFIKLANQLYGLGISKSFQRTRTSQSSRPFPRRA